MFYSIDMQTTYQTVTWIRRNLEKVNCLLNREMGSPDH